MPALRSALNPQSDAFRSNTARMQERLDQVRALESQVRDGSASKREKFDKRGQLLPRERVARLIDRGTPFLELSTLAGLGMHDDDGKKSVLGGGTVIGIGVVAGKRCLITASDSALKGGTISPMGLKKGLRAQEIARENKLPLIGLVESGGANLMYQADIFVDGGKSFANQARLSAMGIPQIAVVHGSSTAGGAYLPGLSDYVVLVKGRSSIYLAGPPLVKAAIGEDASDEDLGGAEMHASVTGLGEYLADNDAHAIALTRDLMDKLNWDKVQDAVREQPVVPAPLYDEQELLGFCVLFVIAGHETTTKMVANAIELLSRHPDQQALLAGAPERVATAVEEVLRFHNSTQYMHRTLTTDIERHGQTMRAGDSLLLLIGAANHDEREFGESAEVFDVTRTPDRHLGFGYGAHFCLGAALARLEGRVALEQIHARLPDYVVDHEHKVRFHSSNVTGWTSLPITFSPGSRVGAAS